MEATNGKQGQQNDFDRLLLEVAAEALRAGVPISDRIRKKVKINTRAKSRFGMCIRENGVYTIELSAMLLTAPEHSCRQTLAHELIHTCEGCNNHGPLFRAYADRMNKAYGYAIRRTNTAEEMGVEKAGTEKTVHYILQCESCQAQIKRSRYSSVVAHPSRYRCVCGGRLRRIR